jgi:hypothetical protein
MVTVAVPAVPPKIALSRLALFQLWKVLPLNQSAGAEVFQLPVPPPPGVTPLALHCKSAALAPTLHASPKAIAAIHARDVAQYSQAQYNVRQTVRRQRRCQRLSPPRNHPLVSPKT